VKWAGGIITILGLAGFVGRSAVRLNAMEEETRKVSRMQKSLQIINLYMKLQDPALYKKAEGLAD
jgi:hypothetical protein